jgi:hypothetical protein
MTDSEADSHATYPVSTAARVLVWVSTLVLPRGAVRERYRLEHCGELSAVAASRQTRYAVGSVMTAWAMRRAVAGGRIQRPKGDSMKYFLVVLAIAIGIAAVIAGGIDDSPGGQLLGILLVVGAVVFGVKVARRST